jgi:hypothetical protein
VKCLCIEVNVTLLLGKTFLSRFVTTAMRFIIYTRNTQCKTALSCARMITEHTNTHKYGHTVSNPSVPVAVEQNTATREYALRYPGRCHPDTHVFRRLALRVNAS